jgi:clan AA aspartic protease (TIGR02281 family)
MMYKCGSPFETADNDSKNWSTNFANDIQGPLVDTINILNVNGMTYVKIKVGSTVQFWLFDTGASDLLINTETEAILKKEDLLNEANYKGIQEYEMANGQIEKCRRYKINGVKIGKCILNNVSIAVTENGKKIILGRSLLNKFKKWNMDNISNTLILEK